MSENIEEPKYDSTEDTSLHVLRVQQLMSECHANIIHRAASHDASKYEEPEKSAFDEFTPKLNGLTYGSEEYRTCLRQMRPAIAHHYAENSHHPEHYERGICGMSLLDLIEMLCDWKAAVERHADSSMDKSLEINEKRFEIPFGLQMVLKNTVKELGWK